MAAVRVMMWLAVAPPHFSLTRGNMYVQNEIKILENETERGKKGTLTRIN